MAVRKNAMNGVKMIRFALCGCAGVMVSILGFPAERGFAADCLVCIPVSSTQLGQDIYTSKSETDSKNGEHMVSMCHTAGGSNNLVTLRVDYDSVPAFLQQGDAYGSCSPGPYVSTCAAMTSSGTTTGIWVPSSAVGDNTALNAYFNNIQSGVASGLQACSATNASQSYRDVHGQ